MARPGLGGSQLKRIALVATLDSKAPAARFCGRLIEATGAHPVVVDTGCLRDPGLPAEVPRQAVMEAAGLREPDRFEGLARGDRVRLMGQGAGAVLAGLSGLEGVLFLGGNQGAAIAALAAPRIPGQVPAVLATTIPPAARSPSLDRLTVVQLTADLVGPPNPVNAPELARAVAALGLDPGPLPPTGSDLGLVGISTLGNTEPVALAVAARLQQEGLVPVVFHASGPGGSRLEELAAAGEMRHVVELAPHELVAEALGDDLYRSTRPRLAPHPGVTRVFLPGTLDYYCLGAEDTIPQRLRGRPKVMHNPLNANVLTSPPERARLARLAGERLREAEAAIALVPMGGWSQSGAAGMPLHDPAGIAAFTEELERTMPLRRLDAPINSDAVGDAVTAASRALRGSGRAGILQG